VALLQKEHQIWRTPKQVEAGQLWRMPVEAGIPVGLLSGWGLMPSGGDKEDTMPVEAGISVGLLSGWQPWPADQKVKIVFGVFTSPVPKYAEQMKAVAQTWGKEVLEVLHQKLLVVGVRGTIPGVAYKLAPQCPEGHFDNYGISCKEATVLTTGYELGADWIVVVGSDNYVFPKNFEERLSQEDPNKPQIFAIWGCGGGIFCEDHKIGLCGGGGYAISRGALDRMIGKGPRASQNFIKETIQTAITVGGNWSDQVTSCISRRRGVQPVNLTGLHPWMLCPGSTWANPIWECEFNQELYTRTIMSKPLTFHYVDPVVMHKIHKTRRKVEAAAGGAPGAFMLELTSYEESEEEYEKRRAASIKMVDRERAQQRQNVEAPAAGAPGADMLEFTSYEEQKAAYIKMVDRERAQQVVLGNATQTRSLLNKRAGNAPIDGICANEGDFCAGNHCVMLTGDLLDDFQTQTGQNFADSGQHTVGNPAEWCVCLHLYRSWGKGGGDESLCSAAAKAAC